MWTFFTRRGAKVRIPAADVSRPVGTVLPFAGTVAPTGWEFCNGSVLNQVTFAALYDVIGPVYNTGGEGGGNFRLPNVMSGKFPMMRGPAHALGSSANVSDHTHTCSPHNHTITTSHTHAIDAHKHNTIGAHTHLLDPHTHSKGTYNAGGAAVGTSVSPGGAYDPIALAGHTHPSIGGNLSTMPRNTNPASRAQTTTAGFVAVSYDTGLFTPTPDDTGVATNTSGNPVPNTQSETITLTGGNQSHLAPHNTISFIIKT